MNQKGFTLVEMLATIVILSLVMGFASYGVVNTINNSKNRSEKIFVDKLSSVIDEYIGLNGSSLSVTAGTKKTFSKCRNSSCSSSYNVDANEVTSIYINDLISSQLVDKAKLVNPANKKECFNGKNPKIRVFKDSDFVYYYYVDLRGTNTSCAISNDNGVINTLPDNLKSKVGLS